MKTISIIIVLSFLIVTSFAQVILPNTGIALRSNTAIRNIGIMDAWDTPAVICSTETGCADVIFVVDTSGSMSGKIDELYTEIGEFAFTLESQGYDGAFGIVTFVNTVNFPADDTLFHDPDEFTDVLSHLNGADGGFEHPRDAAYEAINAYFIPDPDTCQKVIIIITDETEEGSSHNNAELIALAFSIPETVHVYLVSPSGHPVEPVCVATGGQWFDIDSYTLDEVLDAVADDIAEFSAITITLHNNTGSNITDMTVELNPYSCIALDNPGDSIQHTGLVPNGDSAIVTWQIDEAFGCTGCNDCFEITVAAGSYTDTIIGCLFVEDCGCPGIIATVIQPRHCGVYSACNSVMFQFEGCFPVDTNTIVLFIDGETIYWHDPRMVYNPANQTLEFIPTVWWAEGTTIEFYVAEAYDVTGCDLRYSQHCTIIIDRTPPGLSITQPFMPPCGSMITDDDSLHFAACAHDNGAGISGLFPMTAEITAPGVPIPVVAMPGLGFLTITLTNGLGFPPTCEADTSWTGFPGIPFEGFQGYGISCLDLAFLGDCDCDDFEDEDYCFDFNVRAGDIRSYLGGPESFTLCFYINDQVDEADCGPNTFDTCCTWYFTDCDPVVPINLISPTNGLTAADCSLYVNLQWTASSVGTPPIYYDVWVDGALVAGNLTSTNHSMGWITNTSATPDTHTWFVIVHNDCGAETTAVWTFIIPQCCEPVLPIFLLSPNDGLTAADCSLYVNLQWTASSVGTPPIYYDIWVDGALVAGNLTSTNHNMGWIINTSATPDTHTWFIIVHNACGAETTAVWTFIIPQCCEPPSPIQPSYPANDFTADCSLDVSLYWNAATSGTPPIYYDVYFDGVLEAANLTSTTHYMGQITNYSDSTETHTWFVIVHNACGAETTAVWNFHITSCCNDAQAEIGCPYPTCFAFSSCDPQELSFIIWDDYGAAINHVQTYFTVNVFHPFGGSDVYFLNGTDVAISWTGDTAKILWTTFVDGDSIVISLDSTFTVDGCRTTFGP